ncbi:hypothetical protein HDU98_007081 [Podochytrium sp. JEL0797]|nr:hypothetical protein HDU98_007081 [Podochytrium sp. JEL0797]
MSKFKPPTNYQDILSEPIFENLESGPDETEDGSESGGEDEAPLSALLISQPLLFSAGPSTSNKGNSKFSSRSSEAIIADSNAPTRHSNSHFSTHNRQDPPESEEDDAPLSILSRRESTTSIAPPLPRPSLSHPTLTIPGGLPQPIELAPCPDCSTLGFLHPTDRYSCRTTRCPACITCRLCKGLGGVPKSSAAALNKESFSLMSLMKGASGTGSSVNVMMLVAQIQEEAIPLRKGGGVISSVVAARKLSASKSGSKSKSAEEKELVMGEKVFVAQDCVEGGVQQQPRESENGFNKSADFYGIQNGQPVFSEAVKGGDVLPYNGSIAQFPANDDAGWTRSRTSSVVPAVIAEGLNEEDDEDTPLSILPKSTNSLSQKQKYGSDGELCEEGKYTYAQPGTLLHNLPSVLEADKYKRPVDNRYGTGPLIAFDVAKKSHEEHSKICNSLAFRQMIKAQEEQAVLNAQKLENRHSSRLPCDKCDGKGFSHPIDGLKIHDKGPTVECKFCRTCATCCGTGLFLDTTACLDCQSLGYIHPNEPYSCRNTGPCAQCIPCKSCQGGGMRQKTGLTPRLSLVSLTASVSSLARKKSGGGMSSGSFMDMRKRSTGGKGVVISSPTDFRKLAAAGKLAEEMLAVSESKMFRQGSSSVNAGEGEDAMGVSVSGILRDAKEMEEGPIRIPSAILAVPGLGKVRKSSAKSATKDRIFVETADSKESIRQEGDVNGEMDSGGSDDEERDVDSDGALAKALQA